MKWFFIVGGIAALYFLLSFIKNKEKQVAQSVLDKFNGQNILSMTSRANFFGQESLGLAQMRGRGVLVLTGTELYFEMLLPKKELRIALSCITGVESPKAFLGKTKFMPLLKINYTNDLGAPDAVAWLVADLSTWIERFKKI